MNYDKAKTRLEAIKIGEPNLDEVIIVLTQLLEAVEIQQARLDDQHAQMVAMATELGSLAKNLTGALEVIDTMLSRGVPRA